MTRWPRRALALAVCLCAGSPIAAAGPDAGTDTRTPDAALDAGVTSGVNPDIDLGHLLQEPTSVQATAYVSADQVLVGRPFSVLIVVNAQRPGGQPLDVAVPTSFTQGALGPMFDIGRRFTERVTRVGGIPATEIQIELVAWQVGDQMLPAIPVDVPLEGQMQRVYTRPTRVNVIGLVGDDTASLRDIGAPVSVIYTDWLPVYVIGGLLGLAIALLSWWLWRRRPAVEAPRPLAEVELVLEEPVVEARRRLRELVQRGGLDDRPTAPTIRELSAIMRRYLAREFDLTPAGEATSAEVLAGLARHEWISTSGLQGAIGDWLQRCDLVKFADARASLDDARALHAEALTIIADTCAPLPDDTGDDRGDDCGDDDSDDDSDDDGDDDGDSDKADASASNPAVAE